MFINALLLAITGILIPILYKTTITIAHEWSHPNTIDGTLKGAGFGTIFCAILFTADVAGFMYFVMTTIIDILVLIASI